MLGAGSEDAGQPLLLPDADQNGGAQFRPDDQNFRERVTMVLLIINLIQAIRPGRYEAIMPRTAARIIRKLRLLVGLFLLCITLAMFIFLWLLIRGIVVLIDTDLCVDQLRIWLILFLVSEVVWPFCVPPATIMLLLWCGSGMLLLSKSNACLEINNFIFESFFWEFLQLALLISAAGTVILARPVLQQLSDMQDDRATSSEVIHQIEVLCMGDLPAEEECAICLCSAGESDENRWRKLKCDHRFHESCLLEWLDKERECPICRVNLHDAYEVR